MQIFEYESLYVLFFGKTFQIRRVNTCSNMHHVPKLSPQQKNYFLFNFKKTTMRSHRKRKVWCSNPKRDRLKSLKGSDSSTAKRSALDMSVTGLRRWLL